EQEFERLGSGRTQRVDVRLVAATHRDLLQMVEQGQFRSDLYYRLNVFPILLPPLRQRREDIPLLVEHFTETFCRRMHKTIRSIPAETMAAFQSHSWPGNVRELQNIVERAVILATDEKLPNPLRPSESQAAATAPSGLTRGATLKDSERALIIEALESAGWV